MNASRILATIAMLLGIGLAGCSSNGNAQFDIWKGKQLYDGGKYRSALVQFEGVYANHGDDRELAWQYIVKSRRKIQKRDMQVAATASPPPRKASAGFRCGGPVAPATQPQPGPLVSITLVESDLREALLELSAQTGVSIVPDETVQGIISASIEAQPLEKALKMILSPNAFSYKKIDNFYLIGDGSPDNPSFHLLSKTCVYKPVNLRPQEIMGLLSPFYRRFVTVHENRGLLTVVASDSVQDRIQNDIKNFDRQPPQVLMELTVLEVTKKGREILGIDWSAGESSIADGAAASHMRKITGGAGLLGLQYRMTNVLTTEFQASVQWLRHNGNATLKATPSIVTLDGRMASFASMHDSWINLTPHNTSRKNESIRYGVELKIVPHIAENNDIILDIITARVSDLTTGSTGIPEIVSHSISSTVRMREGEALVLGGLLQKKRTLQTTKVPILGDIPILGVFFKNEREQYQETEVLIVIRPKVLGSQQNANVSALPRTNAVEGG